MLPNAADMQVGWFAPSVASHWSIKAFPLDPDLTTRPIAGIHWTIDSAFVHHAEADHLALPFVVQFARQMQTRPLVKKSPSQHPCKPVQLQLLA